MIRARRHAVSACMQQAATSRPLPRKAAPHRASGLAGTASIASNGRMFATFPDEEDGAKALNDLMLAVARDRDRAAFATLFGHFGPRLKAYLLRLGADSGTAEELVQEVMLMVWRRADSFDPALAGAGTWIFTIARNKRIDTLRRER